MQPLHVEVAASETTLLVSLAEDGPLYSAMRYVRQSLRSRGLTRKRAVEVKPPSGSASS